jgi:hypothetical protein
VRGAFSLLEVVIAGTILAMAVLPIVANLHQLFRGFQRTHEATHATFLAQAVVENVKHRLYDGPADPRVGHLNESAEELERRMCRKEYETFFLGLAEENGAVTMRQDGASRYFVDFMNIKGSKLHGITEETNPGLWRELDSYRVSLEVRFSVPDSVIDSDGDGKLEVDMAEIGATVSWTGPDGAPLARTFWTVLSRHQHNPWPQGPKCLEGGR